MWDWMDGWMGDTPQTVMTTRAPAVLIIPPFEMKKVVGKMFWAWVLDSW